jgi:hypothetical protein
MIYDIFYVSKETINDSAWQQFCSRFPSAQKIENVKTIDDIKKRSFTKFFWIVWDDLIIADDFVFDYRVEKWDQEYIHVFLNGAVRDGVCLFPKSASPIQKEFDHRFYFNKKELDIVASVPKPYDVVFISYNESNADANYEKLKLKRPDAKRVHGIKGIHNAHIEAAKLVDTEMFWVVDADAELVDDFNFEIDYFPHYDAGNRLEQISAVHVWSSQNPINDLVYGYGGVKLLPTKLTLDMNTESVDMTTSISKKFRVVNKISNVTAFNTDEFNTWKSAFRECVKLTSKVIDKDYQIETEDRLRRWCRTGKDRPFGEYALGGARLGYKYGMKYISNKEKLAMINDFEWIHEIYLQWESSYLKWKNQNAG